MNLEPTHTTEQVWGLFSKRLLSFIRQQVSDSDVANDLLQDIFVRIHLNLASLSDADKLTGWVYQITRNRLLDYHRAMQLPRNQPVMEAIINQIEVPVDAVDHTPDLARCVLPFIEQLDEIYRDALRTTDINGLSQKEYAQQAGLSYPAAKSRIQRARRQLHRLFTACCRITADQYGTISDYQCELSCAC